MSTPQTQTLIVSYEPSTAWWDGGTREVDGACVVLAYDDGSMFSGFVGPTEGDSLDCWMSRDIAAHCHQPAVLRAVIDARDDALVGRSGRVRTEVPFVG